ncbi:MAG: crossover junction endodeoxyribonuclease RuvC [Desulfohalobiaceae bacterium]
MPSGPARHDKGVLILGVDPGSQCTGFGLVRERSGLLELVETGTVRTTATHSFVDRIGFIFSRLAELIDRWAPDEAAVEDVFVSRNVSSALKLGQVRGAAVVACTSRSVPVFSYEPAQIKKSLVGGGRADKGQVAFMVGQMLGVRPSWSRDSSDALAVALCHLNQRRLNRILSKAL